MDKLKYCIKGKHLVPINNFSTYTTKYVNVKGELVTYKYESNSCKFCESLERRKRKTKQLQPCLYRWAF